MSGIRTVGAKVELLGVAAFNAAAASVKFTINELGNAAGKLGRVTSGMAGMGTKMLGGLSAVSIGAVTAAIAALVAVVTALAAAFAAVVSMGAQYQRELGNIAAISNTSTEQMKQLDAAMKRISSSLPTSLQDLTTASYALAQSGVEIKQQYEGALEAVNNLVIAAGGEMGLADAAQVVGAALKTWKLEASEAEGVTNALTGVALSSAVSFKNVTNAFKQGVPAAVNLGYSYQELAAFIGLLGENFMRDTDAGTAFKSFLMKLQAPSKQAAELMKEYGISLYDVNGQAVGVREVIQRLNDAMSDEAIALKGVTKQERDYALAKIFGSDASRVAQAVLGRTPEAYDQMIRAIYRTNTEEIALAKTHGLLIPQIEIMKNNVANFATTMGQQVAPALANGVESINGLLKRMDPKVPELFGKALAGIFTGFDLSKLESEASKLFGPETTQKFMGFVKILSGIRDSFTQYLIPSIAAFGGTLGKVFGPLSEQAGVFSGVMTLVARALGFFIDILTFMASITIPIAIAQFNLIVDGIKLLGTAFGVLSDTAGTITNNVSQYWISMDENIQNVIVDMLKRFASFIAGLSGVPEAANAIYKSWVAAWTALGGFTSAILQAVGDAITGFLEWLKRQPVIGGLVSAVQGFVAKAAKGAGDLMGGVGAAVGEGLGQAGSAIDNIIANIQRMKAEAEEGISGLSRAMRGGTSDAAAFDQAMIDLANSAQRIKDTSKEGGEPGFLPDTGGADSAADKLKKLTNIIMQLMSDIPGFTRDLAEFVASLEIDTEGRLTPMLVVLRSSKDLLGQMLVAKEAILAVDVEIAASEQRMTQLQAQRSMVEVKIRQIELGYQRQILDIRMQQYAIDQQLWPLKDKLTSIEREMSKLMRENLDLTERRIKLELEAFPLRNKIKDLENQISDIHDKRLALIQREQQLLTEGTLAQTELQLGVAQEDLELAWNDKDVKSILAGEKAVKGLETAQRLQQRVLDEITASQAKATREEELRTIPLEKEKLAQEELLKPIERRIELINRETEQERLKNELVRIGLEYQKRAVEEQIQILEDQRAKLDRVIEGINIEMAQATLAYQQELIELDKVIAEEELRRLSLDETKRKNEEVFTALIAEFLDTMIQSGAFTADESVQVAQRLKMWNDQIEKIAGVANEFTRVQTEANKVKTAIDNIPREVTITITTVYKEVHDNNRGGSGDSGGTDTSQGSYAHGGLIPGINGMPQVITAHSGEEVISISQRTSMFDMVKAILEMTAHTRAMMVSMYQPSETMYAKYPGSIQSPVINNNYDYNVNASYERQQDPVSIAHDLRALVEMTRR